MKVNLEDVIEAMQFTDDVMEYYYNVKTEQIVLCFDDPELEEEIDENYEDYIPLPDKYSINEHEMMRAYIYHLPEGENQDRLFNVIGGRGTFRRFKDEVYDLGLEQQWYQYRDEEYERIARKWCEKNGIEINI